MGSASPAKRPFNGWTFGSVRGVVAARGSTPDETPRLHDGLHVRDQGFALDCTARSYEGEKAFQPFRLF